MRIHDEEDLIKDILLYLQENLNTNIQAINAEKTDYNISEITADADHYLFAGEMVDIPNHIFVALAVADDIPLESNVDIIKADVPFEMAVIFADDGRRNAFYTALRYARALTDTMLRYSIARHEIAHLSITKLLPAQILADERKLIKAGINIEVTIA